MKIRNFVCYNLRNNEHFQFMTEFRDLVNEKTAAALKISPQFDAYLPLYEKEDATLTKVAGSALTPKIQEANRERDEIFSGLVESVKAMRKHWNQAFRDAAMRIQVVLNSYGNISNKTINEQTSAIYNLVQELKSPKYRDDLTNIYLNTWVGGLETSNIKLEGLVKQRNKETADKTIDVSVKGARKDVDEVYKNICGIINARVLLEGADGYEDFIKELNAVIAKFNVKHHHFHPHAPMAEDENDE